MRKLVLCLALATIATLGLKSAVGPKYVEASPEIAGSGNVVLIDSTVLVYLESIAETTHIETARCISGHVEEDAIIFLDAVYETPWLVANQTETGLTFFWNRCPRGTLGWWHTHPWITVRKWAAEQEVSPWNWCGPGPRDTAYHKDFPFMLISIRSSMTCIFYNAPDGTYHQIPFSR